MAKRSCDKGLAAQMQGSTEVKGLAVALTMTEGPQSTLNCIKRHGTHLYQSLALQHLGRVMIAGMISWDTLMHWAFAQPPQQATGRATDPSESAQQEHQGRRQTPATRFFIPHNKSDKRQEVQREDFEDLRTAEPPIGPGILKAQYARMVHKPKSPPSTAICRLQPLNITDTRTRGWQWWAALANKSIYISTTITCTQHGQTKHTLLQQEQQTRQLSERCTARSRGSHITHG